MYTMSMGSYNYHFLVRTTSLLFASQTSTTDLYYLIQPRAGTQPLYNICDSWVVSYFFPLKVPQKGNFLNRNKIKVKKHGTLFNLTCVSYGEGAVRQK